MKQITYLSTKCCIIWIATLLLGIPALSQKTSGGATNISKLSNQEILMLWQQAQKGSRSDNNTIQQLMRSGLDASQVNSFKKRLLEAQKSSKINVKPINDPVNFVQDSSWAPSVPQLRKASPYYGFDFFSNPDISFEATLNINPPKSYILGPGDILTVTLTGINENTFTSKVERDGSFQVLHGDIITLSGLTMDQALQKIKAKMKLPYPALMSGQTKLFLTLDNARNINVYIIGEAERPGKYTVSALSGFFNVLYLTGGPSAQGSLRKLELIRNNKLIETIDFYNFLQKGLFNNELRLEDQDIIRIPVYSKRVMLTGEVKKPAMYELLEKETLADLINYAGSFEGTAYRESAKIVQVGRHEKKIRDINVIDFPNFIPQNADSVYIDRIFNSFQNRVTISGAIYRPGSYELTNGLTLSKLIKNADGLREDAFTALGYIKRKKLHNSEAELVSFDLRNINPESNFDIPLQKDDLVYIASKDSLHDVSTITIAGNVRMPGVFRFHIGMSIEDIILMAGGFTNDAATHKIEIARLKKNKADTLANQLATTVIVDVDSALSGNRPKTLLQPLDRIFVPELLNYRVLGSVQIHGEVLNPGDYLLERRDETISDVINRSGGISPYASVANTQIYRKGTRVATTFLEEKHGSEKFLLLSGDSIFIPRDVPFVEVQGAVFNPQILRYNSANFLSYISESGGTTDKANLKKAYVQYSNGINKKISRFLFFRSYPKVLPGSKIIVPEKADTERRSISIIEISALAGVFSAIVGMIAVLK